MSLAGRALASALAIVSIAGIARVQAPLAASARAARTQADIFLLPPPRELRVFSLGYRSALCDLLWAKLLIEYGRHWAERRTMEHQDLTRFLDGLLELDKDFTPIYRYVDTLLLYRPMKGDERDAKAARAYLERGIREHPTDPSIRLRYGEHLAYMGPSWLASDTERDAWRREGALAIVRAVELGASADRTLAAVTLLNRAGEREAARRALERAYAVTEDDATRENLRYQLEKLKVTQQAEERDRRRLAVEKRRQRYAPFLPLTTFLLVGPPRTSLACVGPGAEARPECPRDWTDALAAP